MRRRACALALAGLLLLSGCTTAPDQAPDQTPDQTESPTRGPAVQTDWSKLGEREKPLESVESRWYDEYTDHLTPRDDYGTLVPYIGLRLMNDWVGRVGYLYGLMTTDGKVVTDAVYSKVYRATDYSGGRGHTLPVIVLKQGDPTLREVWDPAKYAVAAADGSWCTGFEYRQVLAGTDGLLLFGADSISQMSITGEILKVWTVAETELTPEILDILYESYGVRWYGEHLLYDEYSEGVNQFYKTFNLADGKLYTMSKEWYSTASKIEYETERHIEQRQGETVIERSGERYVIAYGIDTSPEPKLYGTMVAFSDGTVYTLDGKKVLSAASDRDFWRVYDRFYGDDAPGLLQCRERDSRAYTFRFYCEDGSEVPFLENKPIIGQTEPVFCYPQLSLVGGLLECLELNMVSYYDLETQTCVFRTYLDYEGMPRTLY